LISIARNSERREDLRVFFHHIKYRKRGEGALSHLSKETRGFFKVFACADGTEVGLGNGIARLMIAFIGGENMREKLKGVPLDPRF
jgi:hypothetical protein